MKYKITDNMIVIVADHKNGSGASLYINTTGRQKRYEIVSIKRIVLSIFRIIHGLISLMSGLKCSKIIIANNIIGILINQVTFK
jgi:hypothetical protein